MLNRIRDQLTMGVLAGATLVMVAFLIVFWLLLYLFQPKNVSHEAATAIFTVIPPTLTTPHTESEVVMTPTIPAEETDENDIMIGSYVEVFDTGSAGLRVRSGAGVNNFVQFIAFDVELYLVQAGPQEADGYRWWFIVSAYDENRSGWAVENYLKAVSIQ